MWVIVIIVGLLFGIFTFSQIILPLFYAWPRARRLESEGKLNKPIPIKTFIIPPLSNGILVAVSIWTVDNYLHDHTKLYYIVLGFAFILIFAQILKHNPDLEADFNDTWKDYLRED
jgi:protein-S-isoprenylcysteine O-methyltransferase Ste14